MLFRPFLRIGKGEIQVKLIEEANQIVIQIIDNGIGIDNELHNKLFVPNFTTKKYRNGIGISHLKEYY